ncbi:response regulator transcription factor [Ideonella sp. BN130291]|uniref:response regulator transcription factor n=1 Tax=Ideonella sp. BN130291 TaxID=3112940 RepID=UPI002E26CD3A|nr:response regulator transcription factor [Ideonella sp. BN130291]
MAVQRESASPGASATVLLVDDHAIVREGLSLLMAQRFPGVALLHAESLAQALGCLQQAPDVSLVLLDLALPDSKGLGGLQRLRQAAPQLRIVVLSADDTPATVRDVLQAGAAGFICKTANGSALETALREVLPGGALPPPAGVAQDDSLAHGLSPRQVQVLRLLVEGAPNKRICQELKLAEPTVKTHLADIFRKLGVNNRTQAALAARRLGLAPPSA